MLDQLIFLKLGGSLITNKDIRNTARKQTIKRLGLEIKKYLLDNPNKQLLIGHGSGSFGHMAASYTKTRRGVCSYDEWVGYQKVWWAARQLNQIVCEILIEVGLPVVTHSASSAVVTENRKIVDWQTYPIRQTLNNGLIPVIYGDVIIDRQIGGTILSTEELFSALIKSLQPKRILLAGKDAGVFRDFPSNNEMIQTITPKSFETEGQSVRASMHQDVTGGMASKVSEMVKIVKNHAGLQIQIFSGEVAFNLHAALSGERIGTIITAPSD